MIFCTDNHRLASGRLARRQYEKPHAGISQRLNFEGAMTHALVAVLHEELEPHTAGSRPIRAAAPWLGLSQETICGRLHKVGSRGGQNPT